MLDRKLLRDLLRMKGQVATIAFVVACGVASFVASLSTYDSLQLSQRSYYEAARFSDLFANLKRAPLPLERQIADLPGVADVETRIVFDVTLDLPAVAMPVVGRIISLPDAATPRLNRLYLRRGRFLEPGRLDEVLVNESFAAANGLKPGDRIAAILNGRREELQIVGIVLSPEYVFATRVGEALPDDRRFGVFWMNRKGLEAAFNMEGAFNDAVLKLGPGASSAAVITKLDRLLDPYGGRGAYDRDEQMSHRFIRDEIRQQRITATTIPVVFLAVAAFLLNMVLTRIVAAQREQIAALKALGYENVPIAMHYFKMVLIIVAVGSVLGIGVGAWLGRIMTASYTSFFRFPTLAFRIQPWVPILATMVGLVSALGGALTGVGQVVQLAPAEAMRPPIPRAFHRSFIERLGVSRMLSARGVMALRGITGRPLRTTLTIIGIAVSLPVVVLGLFWWDALDYMIDVQFHSSERADAVITFADPVTSRSLHEVAHLAGVRYAEALRFVPVRLRAGHRSYRTGIVGIATDAVLRRPLDAENRPIAAPADGIMLTDRLAERLGVKPGESVAVEILEGKRERREIVITALVSDLIGLSAYMEIDALNRLAGEGDAISGAAVLIDSAHSDEFYAHLKEMPKIATVTLKREILRTFMETTAKFVLVFTGILSIFAAGIAVGVVYNSARIALAERAWELASLRVLGFTRAEVSALLLGELGFELVIALPLGLILSRLVVSGLVMLHETDLFRIPAVIGPRTYGLAVVAVLVSAAASALIVRRRIDQLDLVGVLKGRE